MKRFDLVRLAVAASMSAIFSFTSLANAQESRSPNSLFVEAIGIYNDSKGMDGPQRLDALGRVQALFDEIVQKHPESLPAAAIRTPRGPVPDVLTALSEVQENPMQSVSASKAWYEVLVPGGQIGNGYSHGQHPAEGSNTHPGIDIGGGCNLPVLAPMKGEVVRVVKAGENDFSTLGNAVVINHSSETNRPTYTLYLHLAAAPEVELGEVATGQQLGITGETGFAKGCHLHFEVRHFEGIRKVYHPVWLNIYGDGDKSTTEEFQAGWSDPEKWITSIQRGVPVTSQGESQAENPPKVGEDVSASEAITLERCTPSGNLGFPQRMMPEEDSSTHSGRTMSGKNWTLRLFAPGSAFGVAEFTNSAGTTAEGYWRPTRTGICQSYNGRESWSCHDIMACEGETDRFAMRNSEGEITSVIEASVGPSYELDGSAQIGDGEIASITEAQSNLSPEPNSAIGQGAKSDGDSQDNSAEFATVAGQINDCDRLASHQYDTSNPPGILPVDWDKLVASDANIQICRTEYERANASTKGRYAYLLARLYAKREDGRDLAANQSNYYKSMEISAQSNYPFALNWMGDFYHNARFGLRRNHDTALGYYERAIDLGDPLAAKNAAWIYEYGQGRQANLSEAIRLYTLADELAKEAGMTSQGGYQLCRMMFEKQNVGAARQWCLETSDQFTESKERLDSLNSGYTYMIGKCGARDVWPNTITVFVHEEQPFHLPRIEEKFAALSWEILKDRCDARGDRWADIKFQNETVMTFALRSFQSVGPNGWQASTNNAARQYQREQNALAAQRREEQRRRDEAERQRVARDAANRKAAEIEALRELLTVQWTGHMNDQMSGDEVIANVGDLLVFNRSRAIALLSEGVRIRLRTENVNFQEGIVVVVDEHDPTDVYKAVREAELAGRSQMDQFMVRTQQVGVDFSGPSINIVCRLDSSALSDLDGRDQAIFSASLTNLDARSAVFECAVD